MKRLRGPARGPIRSTGTGISLFPIRVGERRILRFFFCEGFFCRFELKIDFDALQLFLARVIWRNWGNRRRGSRILAASSDKLTGGDAAAVATAALTQNLPNSCYLDILRAAALLFPCCKTNFPFIAQFQRQFPSVPLLLNSNAGQSP